MHAPTTPVTARPVRDGLVAGFPRPAHVPVIDPAVEGAPPLAELRKPAASPALVALLVGLSLRGWPTGTDYASITEDDEPAEAGCSFCGVCYAPHERGDHRFCGRHLHLVESA